MNVEILVHATQRDNQYTVRCLFAPDYEASDEQLEFALRRLRHRVEKELGTVARSPQHALLNQATFDPKVTSETLHARITLSGAYEKVRLTLAVVSLPDQEIVFAPDLSEVWSFVDAGQSPAECAERVLHEYCARKEKEWGTPGIRGQLTYLPKRSMLVPLTVSFPNAQRLVDMSQTRQRLILGGGSTFYGNEELPKVGACLDELYPDRLRRAIQRGRLVDELSRALERRRPVLLVGPPGVGKTTLLHEWVYQRSHDRNRRDPRRLWHLNPARVIAGMSYVGEWESRWLAILAEIKKKGHWLYFDDFLGLYQAGRSAQSDLTLANVLRLQLEEHPISIVGEMTPEQLNVFQELDRGFADRFDVIRVEPPTPDENLRILIYSRARLEEQHHCVFDVDVIPSAIALSRRHAPTQAFPGKAALILEGLASRYAKKSIRHTEVVHEVARRTGLAQDFVDTSRRVQRRDVEAELAEELIGQPEALAAAATAISVAKARLNDPERPLGVFLFLGPTGVGKTECAKTITRYLLQDESRLLRFDMNEYVEADAPSRLFGTFQRPEGLLTSAVRQAPASVILFDEIEKAHPDVFDVLLQVLGEGRLTDALGRTVDFTQCIILLTSNLGVREASRDLGFGRTDHERRQSFLRSVESFFRPEFVNRLDRVIPFDRLDPQAMARIISLSLQKVVRREGLAQRQCLVRVSEWAQRRLVATGYDPDLGARAIKRALEQQVVQPVADFLSSRQPEVPMVIELIERAEQLEVYLQALEEADRGVEPLYDDDDAELEESVFFLCDRVEDALREHGPSGSFAVDDGVGRYADYYRQQEALYDLRRRANELVDADDRRSPEVLRSLMPLPQPRRRKESRWGSGDPILSELLAASDVDQFLEEEFEEGEAIDGAWPQLHSSARLLHLRVRSLSQSSTVTLAVRGLGARCRWFGEMLLAGFSGRLGLTVQSTWDGCFGLRQDASTAAHGDPGTEWCFMTFSGPAAEELLRIEEGTHLVLPDSGVPQISVFQLRAFVHEGDDASAAEWGKGVRDERERWSEEIAAGRATLDEDPWRLEPVVRVYHSSGSLDVRSGLMVDRRPTESDLCDFVLTQLPRPTASEES